MTHLLLLLALFFHRSNKEVAQFTRQADDTLASYQDGSGEAWMEGELIAQIGGQIQYLARHPNCRDAQQREHAISDGLAALHEYDQQLQKQSADLQSDLEPI